MQTIEDQAFRRVQHELDDLQRVLEQFVPVASPARLRDVFNALGAMKIEISEKLDEMAVESQLELCAGHFPYPAYDELVSQMSLAEVSRAKTLFPDNTYEDGVVASCQWFLGTTTVPPMDDCESF